MEKTPENDNPEVVVVFKSSFAFRQAPLEIIEDKIREHMYASVDLMGEAYAERRKRHNDKRMAVWDLQNFGKAITRFIAAAEALAKEVKT